MSGKVKQLVSFIAKRIAYEDGDNSCGTEFTPTGKKSRNITYCFKSLETRIVMQFII